MTDAITVEVIRNGLLAAVEEMARNLCRTAYNTVVYEIHDYGLGLHDPDGDCVADAPGVAVFTRANDLGIKKAIDFLGRDAMGEGDVFLLNYPYWSGAHTLDPLVFAPIHSDGVLIGYASCRIHVLDLKQKDAGYVLDSTDMYQEGMVFPAVRLYRGGVENEDIFNTIRFNSRMPDRTVGDIHGQASACVTGARRMRDIAAKYGADVILDAMDAINEHGARIAALGLAALPNGTWTASDFVDSDGVDTERPVKLQATVTITDDEFVVDWSGSDTDVKGPINIPAGLTEAFSSLVYKSLTSPDAPVVAGNFRALRVITEPGSVMHALPPQPTFTVWPAILGGEVILKALAQGMPELVPACSGGDICCLMGLGTNPRTGQPWLEATNEAVGFGAHADGDGEDGIMHMSEPGCRNNPVEVLEAKSTMFLEFYGYRQDSGGAGRYRGGVGIGRHYRFTTPGVGIAMTYKTKSRPWSIDGGDLGGGNEVLVDPGTPDEISKGLSYNHLSAGQLIANHSGGGGGYGDPLERDPAAVARDVANEFVSLAAARDDYGVVLDRDSGEVDLDGTRALRADLARTRAVE